MERCLASKGSIVLRDTPTRYSSDTLETIQNDLARVRAALEALEALGVGGGGAGEEDIAGLPKTGDDSSLKLWCMLLTASAAGIFLVFRRRRTVE